MIYSKILMRNVPIKVEIQRKLIPDFGTITKYIIKDCENTVGYMNIHDIPSGIEVMFLKNQHPEQYSGLGKIADQIGVEHCINRGCKEFNILSVADFNSHALHYLRGNRFYPDSINEEVKKVIESTPLGEKFDTNRLGRVKMYMPQEIIKKYLQIIEKNPILSGMKK